MILYVEDHDQDSYLIGGKDLAKGKIGVFVDEHMRPKSPNPSNHKAIKYRENKSEWVAALRLACLSCVAFSHCAAS